MLQRVSFPFLKVCPRFPPFREWSFAISLIFSLRTVRLGNRRGLGKRTLIVPGDGGLTSKVANAGDPVSPALISPPSPLDLLRMRGLPLALELRPPRGVSLSAVDKRGNASVAPMIAARKYLRLDKNSNNVLIAYGEQCNAVRDVDWSTGAYMQIAKFGDDGNRGARDGSQPTTNASFRSYHSGSNFVDVRRQCCKYLLSSTTTPLFCIEPYMRCLIHQVHEFMLIRHKVQYTPGMQHRNSTGAAHGQTYTSLSHRIVLSAFHHGKWCLHIHTHTLRAEISQAQAALLVFTIFRLRFTLSGLNI